MLLTIFTNLAKDCLKCFTPPKLAIVKYFPRFLCKYNNFELD